MEVKPAFVVPFMVIRGLRGEREAVLRNPPIVFDLKRVSSDFKCNNQNTVDFGRFSGDSRGVSRIPEPNC